MLIEWTVQSCCVWGVVGIRLCVKAPNYEYTGLYSTVAEFQKTMTIFPPFQALVKDFEYRLPLQKADRMVGLIPLWLTGIIPLWPTRRQADGKSVHWASDSPPATVQDMGVNHGRTDIFVPEQFLNCADVVAIFQKMRGEAMTHGVWTGWL